MAKSKTVLKLDVEIETEQRNGYFAARTKPFALTAYAKTEHEAEERAMEAVMFLLGQYMKTPDELSAYLTRKDVKHIVLREVGLKQPYSPPRICKREMLLEVPAGAR